MRNPIKTKLILTLTVVFATAALTIFTASGHNVSKRTIENPADNTEVITTTTTRKIKVALLLDTSNSMDGLIDQAKSQLWNIVNELAAAKCEGAKPEIRIALYEYGNDRLPASEGYIRLVTPLTNDLDRISDDLFKLSTNGGSEFCGHVIQTATKQLDWSPDGNDLQVIFIAGNEPFTQGNVNYREACAEAKRRKITVNTIFCGNYEEGIRTNWKDGADITGGSYMSIEQDRKTVYISSPYDDKIAELNNKLNNTYIEYGREGKQKKEVQMIQDSNAKQYGKANEVNRAVSKSTHVYKNSSWDMVDASEEKGFEVSKVPAEQLPEQMKTMNDEQKQKYIAEKKAEREKIKAEILELSKKREAYITAEKKKQGEDDKMLDKSMINAIKKQASDKKFEF
ncbi:MAG: VWA domain-containing protein [Cytophagaceae bacterium]